MRDHNVEHIPRANIPLPMPIEARLNGAGMTNKARYTSSPELVDVLTDPLPRRPVVSDPVRHVHIGRGPHGQ